METTTNAAYRQRVMRLSRERMQAAAVAFRAGELDAAFGQLEEAHVLGQRFLATHLATHLWMLRVGTRRRELREIVGQLARLCLAPLGHLTGRLPNGNTGGANVGASRPMPIAPHLQALLQPLQSEVQAEQQAAAVYRNAGLGWLVLGLSVAVVDWLIKSAVQRQMPYGEVIPITEFFNLVHVWNTGAAFSFLAGAGGWQRYFFTAVALAAVAVLAWMLMRPQRRLDAFAYSLILGGALGNAVDRIARGYVVDYLDFHWASWHWPAFNVADIAICTAAALLIWSAFQQRDKTTGFVPQAK